MAKIFIICLLSLFLLIPATQAQQSLSYSRAFLLGKFEPKSHRDFIQIAKQYSDSRQHFMHQQAYRAFVAMHQAAKKKGIVLTIRSASRNFHSQKWIWEAKWTGKRLVENRNLALSKLDDEHKALTILRYSSMPGTSRHHWGTDIDLNSFDNDYFQQGNGKKIYQWLQKNALSFGFCQPYSAKGALRPHGYEEEKWHWSYQPLASEMLAAYNQEISPALLDGFLGSKYVEKLAIIEKYVNGIHPDCK